eukprot:7674041-Heterocapsa_arctica.AAC.1
MAARAFGTSANFTPRGRHLGDGGQDVRHIRELQAQLGGAAAAEDWCGMLHVLERGPRLHK